MGSSHIGRSFEGHSLEDDCPCPQEPCGLVSWDRILPDCPQHGFSACKTIRQSHLEEKCPAESEWRRPPPRVYAGDTLILIQGEESQTFSIEGVWWSLDGEALIVRAAPPVPGGEAIGG